MGKVSELSIIVDEIRDCGQKLLNVADSLTELFSGNPSEAAAESEKQTKPEITLEQVRAVLAEKSRAGHTDKVRELLEKHGASKLSEIKPGKYAVLLKEAEVLGDG